MDIGWNWLGIIAWVVIVLALVFIVQHIRKRRLKMIVVDHKRFSWPQFLLDIVEVVVWMAATIFMVMTTFFNDPNLKDTKLISNQFSYQPIVLTVKTDKSYYVNVTKTTTKNPKITYQVLSDGKKITMQGINASVSYDKNPITLPASAYPFNKDELLKMDGKYQNAYLATYKATYKDNWQNGLGLNAGKAASKYYLIRVPDQSFIKESNQQFNEEKS